MIDALISDPDGAPRSSEPQRRILWVGLTGLAVLLRAPTLITRLFDPDEAAIGVEAMVVRSGGTLYRDIFDRKPPIPPLSYAASFALTDSTDVRPMRVLVTLLLVGCGVIVAADFQRRFDRRHAVWGGVLMIASVMALFPADAGAANWAHFAILPGTAAIVWSRRGTLPSAVAAGLAIGFAVLSRQSWILGVVPACVSVGRTGRWRNVPAMLVAATLTVAATGFYAPLGSFWRWNITNIPGFVFAGTGVLVAIGRGLASIAGFAGFHPVLIVAAGICGAAALSAIRRREVPDDVDLWLWLATGLAAWAAGFRFFGHYWLQSVPPLVLLATPMAARWTGRARSVALAGLVVPATVAWALLFVPGSFHHRPDPAQLAAYLRDHTTTSDRVFVWGSYPEVLVAADRLPAGALVHTDFAVGRSGGRNNPAETLPMAIPGVVETMLADLARRSPGGDPRHLDQTAARVRQLPDIVAP